ncbi:MAG TPA: hypothetical protein PKH65_03675 [Bacteroidia bacterium]|nr:hypothetical protein [Bacteroidia bacterium]HNT79759.1 hypothetical protein [Bacteroidia bacterium]
MVKGFTYHLLILSSLLLTFSANALPTPVLLKLNRAVQVDTTGCNYVEQLSELLYDEIVSGRVKLWDSPEMDIQITGDALQSIERATRTSFSKSEFVFIYELWESNRDQLTSETLGMRFSSLNEDNKMIEYGFVEYKSIRELMYRTRLKTNANGDFEATFAYYLNAKLFNFSLVQFGSTIVKSFEESSGILNNFCTNKRFNRNDLFYDDPVKQIIYVIDRKSIGQDELSGNTKLILESFEQFFNNNKELFYNLGGEQIQSHFNKKKLQINRIEVSELWTRKENRIQYDLRSITIYFDDIALNTIPVRDFMKMDLLINSEAAMEVFKAKQFNFVIKQINSQTIEARHAYLYLKALNTYNWSRLSEYVDNY